MKNKILYIFVLVLFALFLFGAKVNAAEYKSKDQGLIITMNDLGVGGTTKSVETKWEENEYKSEGYDYDYILKNITIENIKQATLNEYAKAPKKVNAQIKLKLPSNDVSKIEFTKRTYNETEYKYLEENINKNYKIETINGNKYLVYDTELHYNNISGEEPVDSNIASIELYDSECIYESETIIKIYKANGTYQKYSLDTHIYIVSENEPFTYSFTYTNKYGQVYPAGGAGGPVEDDKWYLTTKRDVEGRFGFYDIYWLPTDATLSDVYGTLYIDVYQGNKIEVEGMGTLNYAGVSKLNQWGQKGIYYVYKNSLNNLKKLTKAEIFKAKTKSGYTLARGISDGWSFNEGSKEEQIKVENTDITLNMIRHDGDLKLGATKAKKTDTIFKKIEKDDYTGANEVGISIADLCIVDGTYQGNINITFDVGTENNGKSYNVYYNKDWADCDYYTGIVKDGKVTITVNTSDIKKENNNMIKIGDVDGDGKVNTKDAKEVLLAYIGKTKLTEEQTVAADVNRDGKVNTKDAKQILLYYIGKIKQF